MPSLLEALRERRRNHRVARYLDAIKRAAQDGSPMLPLPGDLQDVVRAAGWVPNPTIVGVPTSSPAGNQGGDGVPFHWDYPFNWAIQYNPKRRPGVAVSLDTLRLVADNYDVLRSCINELKRQVWTTPIDFAAIDPDMTQDKITQQKRAAMDFFAEEGGLGGRGRRRTHFEGEVIEDVCVIGACAVFMDTTIGGRLIQAVSIDSATIRPVVDAYGWAPDHPYEQWVMGSRVTNFPEDALIYDGIWSMSYQPYFRSPVEWLLSTTTSALKADEWNREYLVSGNTPADIISLPTDWSFEQVKQYTAMWDLFLSGNIPERRKTKFMPGGSTRMAGTVTQDREFADFELWLLRRTCAIMGVQPASIGFTGEQYKVSQEESMGATTRFGAGTLIEFRKTLYDRILTKIGCDLIETVVRAEEPKEDIGEKAKRIITLTGKPVYTVNEGRAELGQEPIEGGEGLADPAAEMVAKSGDGKDLEEDARLARAGIVIDWKPTAERRKKAEAMFQKAIDIFEGKAVKAIDAFAADSFMDAEGALGTFGKDYADAVFRAHAQAAKAGAKLTATPAATATQIGKEAGADQEGFIEKLLSKIRAMLPEKDILEIVDHLQTVTVPLYAHALTATANRASIANVPNWTQIQWRPEPKAKHCPDCPALAAMGPYTPETLPCYPADGYTQCGPNCRCGLQLSDGTYISIHDWTEFDEPIGDIGPVEQVEFGKWMRKALRRLKDGKPAACEFESAAIPAGLASDVMQVLSSATTPEAVRAAFARR